METINKKDLIPVLKKSKLADLFEKEIPIPKNYVLDKITVTDTESFNKTMNQLRYYMVKELPHEIYDYILKPKLDLSNFQDFFFEELTLLNNTNKENLMNESAKKGYLNLVKYAHKIGCIWNTITSRYAAQGNHLEVLKYLHENGCPWDTTTCWFAAENGSLECLKYLYENGCHKSRYTCRSAAEHGHLDCLKYAHENDFMFDISASRQAAENGHLDCFKYCHENGLPFSHLIWVNTIIKGHLPCIKYMVDSGFKFNKYTNKYTSMERALNSGHTKIVEYLKSLD